MRETPSPSQASPAAAGVAPASPPSPTTASGAPGPLRGLTLLHSGAGIEERVMEELVCRTTDGRGLRRVLTPGFPGGRGFPPPPTPATGA